jgi:hypothetical protein
MVICCITKFLITSFEILKLAKDVAVSVQAALLRIPSRVVACLKEKSIQFADSVHRVDLILDSTFEKLKISFEKLKINIDKLIPVRNIAFSESLSIMPLLD